LQLKKRLKIKIVMVFKDLLFTVVKHSITVE